MADLVLGTIIGGVIGVFGSLLGFIIQGHYSKKSTELQIQARREEQKQQFENERKAAQITKLIERRASYLNPINEHLQSITKSTHYIETKIRDLVVTCVDNDIIAWADSRSLEYLNEMMKSVHSISASTDSIEMLRVQNNDKKLAENLSNTIATSVKISGGIYELRHIREKHGEGNVGSNPNKEISDQCMIVLNLTITLFENIRFSNRRIEEILSGMD